jgi:metal-responsive CopG/Arc/MetJ family transcriptional regulator
VDIPDNLLAELTAFAHKEGISRAELMRRALDAYVSTLKQKQDMAEQDTLEAVRGLWKDRDIDGVDYQRQLREEWDR